MRKHSSMRFSEADFESPGQLDFVPRERKNQVINDIIAFFIALVLLSALLFLSHGVIRHTHATLATIAIVIGLAVYVLTRKQQNLDLVMNTEYQNMLFSQASVLGFTFILFARRDGTIVYASEGLAELFPHVRFTESKALDAVFEEGSVNKTDRERLMNAIYASRKERLVFPIVSRDGTSKDYILTIEPIKRPTGYAIVRAREYYPSRTSVEKLPDTLRTTSAERIDHLLASTMTAHYITDAFGKIEYANQALDSLLGYAPGELVAGKHSINALLYQLNSAPVPEDYTLGEFYGSAALKHKQGALVQVVLQQVLQREPMGKVLGSSGTIMAQTGAAS